MPRPARPLPPDPVIERQGRVLLLAYDQGMEHGPADFNDQSIDPAYILDIAEQGGFTGIVMHKGLASAYYRPGRYKVPLVLKLNARPQLSANQEGLPVLTCTVAEAAELGAKAVGYSLYLGGQHESQMMAELAGIVRDAHERRLPVIAWMSVKAAGIDERHRDILAYAGRIALELGADYAELQYGGSTPDYAWVVESAGNCKVIAPGGVYKDVDDTVALARSVLQAGGVGLVVGRRVWQAQDPLKVAKALQQALWREGGRPRVEI